MINMGISTIRHYTQAILGGGGGIKGKPLFFLSSNFCRKRLHKNNDRKGALITIKSANQWAKSKKNDNYIEQTNLFWQSLLTKK